MAPESRHQRRRRYDLEVRMELAEDDLDDLEAKSIERDARVSRLLVAAAGLLVSVCTAILVLFVTGLVGR